MMVRNPFPKVLFSLALFSLPFVLGIQGVFAGLGSLNSSIEGKIYTKDPSQVIMEVDESLDPIRHGMFDTVSPTSSSGSLSVDGVIIGAPIEDYDTAMDETLHLINIIMNYALGALSVIALVYLIYHGFLVLTAAGDDGKQKKGMKGIRFATIALIGIGASWLIVSLILRFVSTFTSPS